MNVYLAARFSRRKEMQAYADDLIALGHRVSARWVVGPPQSSHHPDQVSGHSKAYEERVSVEDLKDVAEADCIICFSEQPRETNTRGGRHVEFGLAVAADKRIILVGPRENVFHFLPVVENFPDWAAVRVLLESERAAVS
ncbi:MAG: hypothetical protein IIC95_07085 [Chloroflexi bacterium]|nr:hypothetical protein [Chloroflexota bacterium]